MGNYNPRVPQVIGQEWVAIRDQGLVLDPFANTLERGYTFNLPTATRVNNVRFYLKEWPDTFGSSMIYTAAVYPQGAENSSGPVRSVIIPTSTVSTTGSAITAINSSTASADLYGNGDNLFLYWIMGNSNPTSTGVAIFYAVNAFAPLLAGKRILGVDLLFGVNVVSQGFEIEDIFQAIRVDVATDNSYDPVLRTDTFRLPDLITNRTPLSTKQTVRMHMGDANRFFGVTAAAGTGGINQIMPWTYPELQRFEASATDRLHILLSEGFSPSATLGPEVQIEYSAMEVFYCDETRVLVGSRIFNDDIPNRPLRDPFTLGSNAIVVRNPTTLEPNYSLPAGNYTLTLGESNMGDNYYAAVYRATAELNQVRELYDIPSLQGVQINLPFPLNENTVGTTFVKESTALIPQLTMHLSGGSLVEYSHVYGQQSVAQVYGNVIATQEVDDRFVGAARQWPWVRFYARRYGNTSVPLRLDSLSPTVSGASVGNYVQITPAEWDALDEITDRWKEVNLLFGIPPTMGTGVVPTWRWSAFNETAGNRWEVLGVTAPAGSGAAFLTTITPVFNQVPATQRLYLGTYGYPTSGAAINEDWNPQWGPYVSPGLCLPGASGAFATTPDNAALDITGDIDIRVDMTPNGWVPAVTSALVAKWGVAGQRSYLFNLTSSGLLELAWSTNGTAVSLVDSTVPVPTGWSRMTVRATLDVDNGAAGNNVAFYYGPTVDGPWTQLGTTVTTGGVTSIFSGNLAVEVGSQSIGTASLLSGVVHVVQIHPGINVAPVATPNFSSQPPNTTTFTDSVTRVWTINGAAGICSGPPDQASDATIIFSQYMPTVTGFGVVTASQAITGIGQNCGIDPCGIPTRILYNQLSWGLPPNTAIGRDNFDRSVSAGWGTASGGGAWTVQTGAAADFNVNGLRGTILPSTGSLLTFATLSGLSADFDITVTTAISGSAALNTSMRSSIIGRFTNTSSYYEGLLQADSAGVMIVGIISSTGGVLATKTILGTTNNMNQMKLRFVGYGRNFKIKAWSIYVDEPEMWQIETQDTSITTGTGAGLGARWSGVGGVATTFDDFIFNPPDFWFDYYELQRSDSLTDWQTIMKATSPAVTGFKDFEARTDMVSNYRIRAVGVYEFPGLWSTTASISMISPGVSGSCLSNGEHVMIFTSNERQNGLSNLAYSNAWEGQVTEDFGFAEAGFTELQPMFDRDFFTAFRPTERGGDQFSRTVLVQAAAIAAPTLPGFTRFSDLAWADLPYVCVRDEEGNRWFANINVPTGVVQNRRKLYMATVQIVEVTDTPSPVDPAAP